MRVKENVLDFCARSITNELLKVTSSKPEKITHDYMGILVMTEKKEKEWNKKGKRKKRIETLFCQFGFDPEYFRRNQ